MKSDDAEIARDLFNHLDAAYQDLKRHLETSLDERDVAYLHAYAFGHIETSLYRDGEYVSGDSDNSIEAMVEKLETAAANDDEEDDDVDDAAGPESADQEPEGST